MIAALGIGHVCGINAVALFQRNHGNPTCVSFRGCDGPRLTDTGRGDFHAAIAGAFSASNWSGVLYPSVW